MVATFDLELSVSVKSLLVNPKKELLPILQNLDGWLECGPGDVEVEQLSGAMTNLIYRCRNQVNGQYVLARVFGSTGALFERDAEQDIFAAVAHAGLGPKLLACFKNGRLEEFLLDQSVTASQMRTRPIAVCIAAAMAMFNFTQLTKLPQSSRPKPICWTRLKSWAKELQALYSNEELDALQIADLPLQISSLQKELTASGPTWIGFCHNDTQYGNMLLHHASAETLEAKADAEDMLTTRNTFDEQPSGTLAYDDTGVSVELGSSPPSFSYLMSRKVTPGTRGQEDPALRPGLHSSASQTTQENVEKHLRERDRDAFPISDGKDTKPDAWSFSRPNDMEESQGGSPRKHPRGLSMFESDLLKERGTSKADSFAGDNSLSIRFIDYEYAGFNPVALDIANHWCEYMADYHAEPPHQLYPSRFPNEKLQRIFCRAYIRAVIALKRQKEELALPSRAGSLSHSLAASAAAAEYDSLEDECQQQTVDHLAEKLRQAALAYVPISHLGWGIWGLLQARLSDVPSFDFTTYAAQRLDEFRKWRHSIQTH